MPSQEEQVGHKLEFIQLKHCLQKEIKKKKRKKREKSGSIPLPARLSLAPVFSWNSNHDIFFLVGRGGGCWLVGIGPIKHPTSRI